MGDDRDDPDRTAILRRRNRLIALALSGIGAAAGCGDPAPCLEPPHVEPMPCLEPPHVEPHVVDPGPTVPDEPETHPVPCLAPPPQPTVSERPTDEPTSEPRPLPLPPGPSACLVAPYDMGDRVVPRKP